MGTTPYGQLPPDLVSSQRRFQAWREQRHLGCLIPLPLWELAIPLAKAHGVSRTAPAPRLDCSRLKDRVEAATACAPEESRHAFVELTPPVIVARQFQFEFDNGSGAAMRVQLVGYDAADVGALSQLLGRPVMLRITRRMKILIAVEPADPRLGIDGLARLCQEALRYDPFAGAVLVFRDRKATALRLLIHDGQGFWLCHKRLSQGCLPWWPSAADGAARRLAAHQPAILLSVGDPTRTGAAADGRPVGPPA